MEQIKKIWKDPVWSKVIAAGIIGAIVGIWGKLDRESLMQVVLFFKTILIFEIPLYYVVVSAILLYGCYLIYRYVNKKKLKFTKAPILNEQVGEYLFGDLALILSSENLPLQTRLMEINNVEAPTDNLLLLFDAYYTIINRGVSAAQDYGDHGYIWGCLAPRFADYGLVKTVDNAIYTSANNDVVYIISENGRKFHALLQKYHLYTEQVKIA